MNAVLYQECSAEEIETQAHCLECPRWESLKSGLELDKIPETDDGENEGHNWLTGSRTSLLD